MISDPNRQITASPLTFVVLRPVGHTLFLLRNIVATIGVEFVRHLQHLQENKPQPISADWLFLQQRPVQLTTKKLPTKQGFEISMSGKENCYDCECGIVS